MPKLQTPLHVWFDCAVEPIKVTSDQRDLARWEAHKDWQPNGRHIIARFVAWSALTRTGQYTDTWEQFGTDCIEVESLVSTEQAAEDEQGLDPGNRPTSATD